MKKLYINITNVNIKGDISTLTEAVSTIDLSLQNITNNTYILTTLLAKFSSSNSGKQYENVLNVVANMTYNLQQASISLNDLQHQIVEYQNKLYRYEGLSQMAQQPNQCIVQQFKPIAKGDKDLMIDVNQMTHIANQLKNYGEAVFQDIRKIVNKKNSLGSIWRDIQYKDFSEFIDGIEIEVTKGLEIVDNFYKELLQRIKELSQ